MMERMEAHEEEIAIRAQGEFVARFSLSRGAVGQHRANVDLL
jgi:hypothetical protein